jgi:hypothetical protein
LYWRNTPPTQKRSMLIGTLPLIPAATTRPVPPEGPREWPSARKPPVEALGACRWRQA